MKAVVFHDIGDVRLDTVSDPRIEQPTDAIVRITASALCGTDLHMVRGTLGPMEPGTVMGHEGVGIVEEVGAAVRNLRPGDRVVVSSTIACGFCVYCRAGYYSQCDNSNPNGMRAGTAFYGGPAMTGHYGGLQAELARIPFASINLIKLPKEVTDNQAIMLSDIFPTGYFGADLAEIRSGDAVAVFGCGPVGQFAIASAKLHNAGRIFAIDHVQSRLEMARDQGAEVINFEREDPVEAILQATGGIGVDRAIDAVGVDAERPHAGPARKKVDEHAQLYDQEIREITSGHVNKGDGFRPGDAPSLALEWEVDALDKAGTLAVIGVYPENAQFFPLGKAMNKNLTIKMGNCNHRKYIPKLVDLVESSTVDPQRVLTQAEPISSAVDAYKAFDKKQGWVKVEVIPGI